MLTQTAQIATNFSQDLICDAADLARSQLDPADGARRSTRPARRAASRSAARSRFENLFLLNGVSINENIRGTAFDLYIEDAIQETTVANGGVSAEFGRFCGGVVNVITKSGGNDFSGRSATRSTTTSGGR